MPTVHQDVEVRDKGSAILDQITKKLGLMSNQGIKMGIAFAGVNIAMNLAQQTISKFVAYMQEGVEMNRKFEMSMTRVALSVDALGGSIDTIKTGLLDFSILFGTDITLLTEGLKEFTREEFNAVDSMKMLYLSSKLQAATGTDLLGIEESLINAMETFNLDVSDSSSVIEKFNDLTSNTGMNVSELGNIFGRTALSVQAAGINFNDLLDIIYTLNNRGMKTRNMIAEINKLAEDPKLLNAFKTTGLPEAKTDVSEKYKKIGDTIQFTSQQMEQANNQYQMGIAKNADIGAYFDKRTVDAAKNLVKARKDGNQVLLQEYEISKQMQNQAGGGLIKPLMKSMGLGGIDYEIVEKYANALQFVEEQEAATANTAVTLEDHLKELSSAMYDYESNIAKWESDFAGYKQDKERSQVQYDYAISLHAATQSVQAQEDAIERLRRVSNAYSYEQQTNNLEIMRMEYAAGSRGLRRGDKKKVEAIEHENLRLRILETEQQLAIGKIEQTGLQDAQDNLDNLSRKHDQVIYNQELEDLSVHLDDVYKLYHDMYIKLEQEKAVYLGNSSAYNQTLAVNTPGLTGNRGSGVWKGGRATGGPIFETGLYTLHKGEYVMPKSGGGPSGKANVNIKIDLTIKNQDNAERLAMRIGQLIAQGYLTGVDCVYHLGG